MHGNKDDVTMLFCLLLQGANASALEKEIGSEQFPVNEHYFGLVNVSGKKQIRCFSGCFPSHAC